MQVSYRDIIIIFGIFILFLPLFFERIYDDEAIYWNASKTISQKGLVGVSEFGRMPLAVLIISPFPIISDTIFVPRIISILFAIGSSVIIFEIVKLYSNEKAAFISSMLFIFSFQTIRFATRFYLDIYGVFFFLFCIYLTKKNKDNLAGFSFALAMLSREIWFGLYPFMLLYLWSERKNIFSFLFWSATPILIFAGAIQLASGLGTYLSYSGFSQNAYYLSNYLNEIPKYFLQNWLEFLVIQILTVIGFVASVSYKRDNLLILILPQFVMVSLIQGFIYNGAITQYPMGLQASMALLAGPGIVRIWKKYFQKYPLNISLFSVLILQFLLFSYLATILSLRGAIGVHDFGYWDDEAVIQLLNQRAGNESIAGLHGAFIKDAKNWVWYERDVEKILQLEPDWYVVTEPQLIKFKTESANTSFVEIYRIGPYIVLNSNPRGYLHEVIEPNEEFNKWMFRR